ncbi:MAG: hypothetical protein KDB52_09370 [Solirubrobacterales bacterium]|nr:hypothetical protein [Solirubrobacterales bacterium]
MKASRGIRGAVLAAAFMFAGLLVAGPASADMSEVPTSTVTGPIPATTDSYPFLATDIDLDKYG